MEFCPHCMMHLAASVYRCPRCGKQTAWENPSHLLPVGTILKADSGKRSYQLGAYLGQGGFGVTYIAVELETKRRTAVKEYFPTRCARRGEHSQLVPLPGEEAAFEGGRFSFLKEARMLASLEGMPAVVQGYEYLEKNNTAYLVMEYLDGTPLYRIVNEKGRIAAEELLPKLLPLLRDMELLHAAGVIHRDVSPDNVMWMSDGRLKLLDFGCARSMEDGKSMTVALKQGFAPVEQYQTHGQGPWTDVYALSATIYYCLTGIIPPSAPDRLCEDTLKSPVSLGVAISPEEEAALTWGMTVNPKHRPADMGAFAKRLFPSANLDPAPLPPPPAPPLPPLPKWKRWLLSCRDKIRTLLRKPI